MRNFRNSKLYKFLFCNSSSESSSSEESSDVSLEREVTQKEELESTQYDEQHEEEHLEQSSTATNRKRSSRRQSIKSTGTPTQEKQSRREGQFRNPDHYRLTIPAVVVHTSLTPGLGRRIPVDDENAVMVHFVFEREVERGVHLAYKARENFNTKCVESKR